MECPDAKALWTELKHPLDRQHLDARQSGDSEISNGAKPLFQLAEMFNTGEFNFRNISCKYVEIVDTFSECGVRHTKIYYHKSGDMECANITEIGSTEPLSFEVIFPRV
jgi:hypothetical protein